MAQEILYDVNETLSYKGSIYNDDETTLMIDDVMYQGGEGFSALDVFIRDVVDNQNNYAISGTIYKIEDYDGTIYVYFRHDNCDCMYDYKGDEIKTKCDCEGSYELFTYKAVNAITLVMGIR